MKIKGKLRILINIVLILWVLTCFVKWLDWADVQDTYVQVKAENNAVMLSGGYDEDLKASQSYLDGRATRKYNQFKGAVISGCVSIAALMAASFIYSRYKPRGENERASKQ